MNEEYISTPLIGSSIVHGNEAAFAFIYRARADYISPRKTKRTEIAEEKLSLRLQLSPLSYPVKKADQDSFSELAGKMKTQLNAQS